MEVIIDRVRKSHIYCFFLGGITISTALFAEQQLLIDSFRNKQLEIIGLLTQQIPEKSNDIVYAFLDIGSEHTKNIALEAIRNAGVTEIGYKHLGVNYITPVFLGVTLLIFLLGLTLYSFKEWKYVIADIKKINEAMQIQIEKENSHFKDNSRIDIKTTLIKTVSENMQNLFATILHERNEIANNEKKITIFLENIAHQIKTPLTGLSLIQEWLLIIERDDEKKELLLHAEEKIMDMQLMIQYLLQTARLNNKTTKLNLKRQYVSTMLVSAYQAVTEMALMKNIDIHLSVNEELKAVYDFFWMKEAIQNLLKNAIEHTGEKTRIEILVEEHDSYLDFIIKDQGEGIKKEEEEHLFKRFYTKEKTSLTNSGIGLNLSWEIARHHGGKLEIIHHEGAGAWFRIRIPQLTGK